MKNMWMVAWNVRFDAKDAFMEFIEQQTQDWADAVSMFEVADSGPSGLMDGDDLPIALMHTIEAYGRSDPKDALKGLLEQHPPACIMAVEEDPAWMEPLPPRQVGRFWIDANNTDKPGLWTLPIHSATAFGSGEHPTTLGCLTLMDQLQQEHPNVNHALDLGCGSGILAIGASYLWPNASITATDIDPEAVRVTERHIVNIKKNDRIKTYVSNGCESLKGQKFNLVVANILLNPLLDMAHDIATIGTQHLITAGILDTQAEQLEHSYEPYWKVAQRWSLDGWCVMRWIRI